jgi:hypothetical protein
MELIYQMLNGDIINGDIINGDINSVFENEDILSHLLAQEHLRRIKHEGSPSENLQIITENDGSSYKIRENGKKWDVNIPCVSCNEDECFDYLTNLSELPPVRYIYNNETSLCNNPQNNTLLYMLCSWRKHVKETFIIQKSFGSDKWKKCSICTSELTFLGRKTATGGIIGIVSLTNKTINSLPSLVSLMEKEPEIHNGVKCLSAGFVMLIAMYMGWDLYTRENVIIINRLLQKIRANGVVGLNTFTGSPWYSMFKCLLERRRIPDSLREMILSRAHLP